jgi:predicted pyridoxine 5'-phosphate oxidase superfamily flavin-nucleotide-binding protein
MGILTDDMKRVVNEQKLGFIATVCPDGTPNLSRKGTTEVWDDDHLIFVDIKSPGTVANLRQNPAIEINVIDQLSVERALPLISPGYDLGLSEDEMRPIYRRRFEVLWMRARTSRRRQSRQFRPGGR